MAANLCVNSVGKCKQLIFKKTRLWTREHLVLLLLSKRVLKQFNIAKKGQFLKTIIVFLSICPRDAYPLKLTEIICQIKKLPMSLPASLLSLRPPKRKIKHSVSKYKSDDIIWIKDHVFTTWWQFKHSYNIIKIWLLATCTVKTTVPTNVSRI